MTFTKADLMLLLMSKLSVSRQEARAIVEKFFEYFADVIVAGNVLKIANFGRFFVKKKMARPGRNPKTRVPAEVSERYVLNFQAAQTLKKKINEHREHVVEKLEGRQRKRKLVLGALATSEVARKEALEHSL